MISHYRRTLVLSWASALGVAVVVGCVLGLALGALATVVVLLAERMMP